MPDNDTPPPPLIHTALAGVMQAVPVVRKEDRNNAQNFNFRGIDAVLNAVGPALRENGVVVLPEVTSSHAEVVEVGRNKTPMKSVLVIVRYRFVGPAGDHLDVTVPGEAMDSGDKAYSKAMSVAFRTALLQTLALPTDEKDSDQDVYERAPAERAKTERPRTTEAPPADLARNALLSKVRKLGLVPGDVAKLYFAETSTPLGEETDVNKILDFTKRLEPGK